MTLHIKQFLIAAALGSLSSLASAASLSVDVPVSVDVLPTCNWASATAESLSTADLASPATTTVQLIAICDAGVAYTVKSDLDLQSTTLTSGEQVEVGLYSDPSCSTPLASGPGISGTAPDTGAPMGEQIDATVYVRATGAGPGGGFLSSGEIAQRTFALTISY